MPPTKKAAQAAVSETDIDPKRRPRINKMTVRNFRCIREPVVIEIDDIVVLVGPNNSGKSSLLRAYEVVMGDGSSAGKLTLEDFPEGKIDSKALPEIELETVVFDDNAPGDQWVDERDGEKFVRERWWWEGPEEKAIRQGFDVKQQSWSDQVPWGAANVANARRPRPQRISAFDSPEERAAKVIELLMTSIKNHAKALQKGTTEEHKDDYSSLLKSIEELQKRLVETNREQIQTVEDQLSNMVSEIFPGYKVQFDAKPEDDLDKALALFNSKNAVLRMGPGDGFQSPIQHQGSGAQRTLMWSTLRLIASSDSAPGRPNVLLLDEPEICLHPALVREACRTLYDLRKLGNWQVMITTHSPVFIDFSQDNTTIVRVDREKGVIKGTTVFRPSRANLSNDERESLKLLNACDPQLAEFFFGGRVIIVEGDTEYSAFKYVISQKPEEFRDVHVLRARGKANICTLVRILNQFGASYSVLHDSDQPTVQRKAKTIVNPAWTNNERIHEAVGGKARTAQVRLLASLPNFEEAYLDLSNTKDKPYTAVSSIRANAAQYARIEQLLKSLLDLDENPPAGCIDWTYSDLEQLKDALTKPQAIPDSLPAV